MPPVLSSVSQPQYLRLVSRTWPSRVALRSLQTSDLHDDLSPVWDHQVKETAADGIARCRLAQRTLWSPRFYGIKPRAPDTNLSAAAWCVLALVLFACHFCGRIGDKRNESMETTADQRKCHNCGQVGHIRRDCPEAPSQEGGFGGYNSGAACFGCGKVGHLKRDCPTSAGGRACHNCGQTGHIRRDCPEEAQPPKCHNCGETGHLRRDCPQELRESRKCHHCGQTGHLRRDCPDDSGPSEDKCYQCGETGHWARNCPGAKA